jgi:hypothetical protein
MCGPFPPRHRAFARLLVVAGLLCGCSDDDPEFVCEGSTEPARACCDFARAVLENCNRCNPDSERDCVDSVSVAIDDSSNGAGCDGADGLRDSASFYDECLPALRALACTDTAIPDSCRDQIRYDL